MRDTVNSQKYHVPVAGFTQAVRAPRGARLLFVSGLTARQANGDVAHVGDIAGQTRQVLTNLQNILEEAGATLDHVVRIVTYLRNIEDHPAMHAVRREYFGDEPPASTTVEISRLYHPDQLIEVEATAALPD